MKYRTIVADPPWRYEDGFANNPKPGTRGWKPLALRAEWARNRQEGET